MQLNKNGTSDGYSFSSANYKAGKCGGGYILTVDIPQGNTTFDAAAANMGAPWKMPTQSQCKELKNNTTNTWTAMNGVNGYKFINKFNSNKFIFLPAGGNWYYNTHYDNAKYGCYWSTVYGSSSYTLRMYFSSNGVDTGDDDRYQGLSIHGIQ